MILSEKEKSQYIEDYDYLVKLTLKRDIKIEDNDLYADLYQEGRMGVLKAIEKFDESMGYKFSTYAKYWIFAYITYFISKNRYAVKVSKYWQKKLSKLRKDLKEEDINFSSIESISGVSLDQFFPSSDGSEDWNPVLAFVSRKNSITPEDLILRNEALKAMNKAFATLTQCEQDVVSRHFLNKETETLEEIGINLYGNRSVSKARIKQIEDESIIKIKKYLKNYDVVPYAFD